MRPFVTVTALALALLPAAAFAQNPPAQQQPPATPPAAQTPAAPAQPTTPKLVFSGYGRPVTGADQTGSDRRV